MKLTIDYVNAISNWWIQLLKENHQSATVDHDITRFKLYLDHALSNLEFIPGDQLEIRIDGHQVSAQESPLALAFMKAATSAGILPTQFPHGARLIINEVYEIITCNNNNEMPRKLVMMHQASLRARSFDATTRVSTAQGAVSHPTFFNHQLLAASKKRARDEEKELSYKGSPLAERLPVPASFQQRTSISFKYPKSAHLVNNLFFAKPVVIPAESTHADQAVKRQIFEYGEMKGHRWSFS